METAYVTGKGPLVIPASLRRRFCIKAGTKVRFIERDGEIVIQPITSESIQSVCGMLSSDKSMTRELLKERAKDRQREERKLARLRAR